MAAQQPLETLIVIIDDEVFYNIACCLLCALMRHGRLNRPEDDLLPICRHAMERMAAMPLQGLVDELDEPSWEKVKNTSRREDATYTLKEMNELWPDVVRMTLESDDWRIKPGDEFPASFLERQESTGKETPAETSPSRETKPSPGSTSIRSTVSAAGITPSRLPKPCKKPKLPPIDTGNKSPLSGKSRPVDSSRPRDPLATGIRERARTPYRSTSTSGARNSRQPVARPRQPGARPRESEKRRHGIERPSSLPLPKPKPKPAPIWERKGLWQDIRAFLQIDAAEIYSPIGPEYANWQPLPQPELGPIGKPGPVPPFHADPRRLHPRPVGGPGFVTPEVRLHRGGLMPRILEPKVLRQGCLRSADATGPVGFSEEVYGDRVRLCYGGSMRSDVILLGGEVRGDEDRGHDVQGHKAEKWALNVYNGKNHEDGDAELEEIWLEEREAGEDEPKGYDPKEHEDEEYEAEEYGVEDE